MLWYIMVISHNTYLTFPRSWLLSWSGWCSGLPSCTSSQSSYLCSEEGGYTRAAFMEVSLPADTPAHWISVNDWTLQWIGLMWYFSMGLHVRLTTANRLDSLSSFIFYSFSDSKQTNNFTYFFTRTVVHTWAWSFLRIGFDIIFLK